MDDWAQTAADTIISDLTDRSGLGDAFEGIDADIQEESRTAWADIIRRVAHTDQPK